MLRHWKRKLQFIVELHKKIICINGLILAGKHCVVYCETLNILGVKFLCFNENDIIAHFNFGIHILWLKIVKKI